VRLQVDMCPLHRIALLVMLRWGRRRSSVVANHLRCSHRTPTNMDVNFRPDGFVVSMGTPLPPLESVVAFVFTAAVAVAASMPLSMLALLDRANSTPIRRALSRDSRCSWRHPRRRAWQR
jgi:hypothetical protein